MSKFEWRKVLIEEYATFKASDGVDLFLTLLPDDEDREFIREVGTIQNWQEMTKK